MTYYICIYSESPLLVEDLFPTDFFGERESSVFKDVGSGKVTNLQWMAP